MRPAILAGLIGSQKVGGLAVGSAGAAGTMYEGYKLSWGDEFGSLDLLSPANSRGKWWSTRTYLAGARGSDTLLGTMYDTDPFMTGYNDSNRGVPVGYSNMSQTGSVLSLQARKATTAEQAHMQSVRNEVGAMISGPGAVHWYPGASGTADIIYEARLRFSAAAGNPAGWHPTLWLQSLNPVIAIESDELDWEGNGSSAYFHRNLWTAGSNTASTAGSGYAHDGAWHTISFVINTTQVQLYIDGALYATGAWNGNAKSKPQYPLVTSHIYNGTFEGQAYSASAWNADADGATLDIDWMRVWRRSAASHFAPRAALSDQYVAYGGSLAITLPSALLLWGDSGVTEYLQAVYNEENEPGVDHSTAYTQFPAGVSYDTGTRTLTVNITSGKTGRINFICSAWKPDGSTGEPLRFAVNVGPRVTVSSLSLTADQAVSYDLYAACDCGVLTTNGTSRTKTISVSGLDSSGLSYSDATGLLTGTAVAGNYTLAVTVTNSVGQSVTSNIAMTVSAATSYAHEAITENAVGWFDASDSSTITLSGSNVATLANKRTGMGDLTGGGAARTVSSAAVNGRNAIAFVRDVSGTTSEARLTASETSALSVAFQGANKPYTSISVYKPTDSNTGYIWAASDTVNTTDSQIIGLVRRSASASSARRQLVTATTNDASFGSGQASDVLQIVAIIDTGTAVTVYESSVTASVVATSRTVGTFNSELTFRIGASETNGTADPALAATACAMLFCEKHVWAAALSDAVVQQAITDLASKWGKTLS